MLRYPEWTGRERTRIQRCSRINDMDSTLLVTLRVQQGKIVCLDSFNPILTRIDVNGNPTPDASVVATTISWI